MRTRHASAGNCWSDASWQQAGRVARVGKAAGAAGGMRVSRVGLQSGHAPRLRPAQGSPAGAGHIHVPAQHGLTPETDCGPASGVVLAAQGEPTLYLAGDTVWYQAVAASLERFRPQVTVLNCCGATLASRGRIIMDEEDVLTVCQAAPWTRVVASHMEAVNHGNVSRAYLRTFCDRLGVGDQVLIPADGETLEF